MDFHREPDSSVKQNLLRTNNRNQPSIQHKSDWADSTTHVSFETHLDLTNNIRMINRKPIPTVESRYVGSIDLPPDHAQDLKKFRPLRLTWTFEICAIILSLGALAAIIVLLKVEDSKPLGNWNGVLSLNTVVSIVGVVSRALLMFAVSSCIGQGKWNWFRKHTDPVLSFRTFDDASRGPWGGAQLIWKLNVRHIATLGSITTIIMLGFDPFLQAVISYEGQLDNLAKLDQIATIGASIPRLASSTRLDSGIYQPTPGGGVSEYAIPSPDNTTVSTTFFASQPDLGMAAAVFDGFNDPSTSTKSDPSYICSTGNCTFPLLTSLFVCSTCNDISSFVVRNRTTGDPLEDHPSNFQLSEPFTQYILPGLTMSNLDGPIKAVIPGLTISSVTTVAIATYTHNDTITFKTNSTMISSVMVMRAGNSYIQSISSWETSSIIATECMLYFCVNSYEASVRLGKYSQNIVHSWTNRNLDSYLPVYTDGFSIPNNSVSRDWAASEDYDLVIGNGDLKRDDLQIFIPANGSAQMAVPEDHDPTFNISQAAVGSIVNYLQNSFFDGKMIYGYNSSISSQPVTQSLGTSTNLTQTFALAAESMSNWIRNSANTTQEGVLQQWVLHVKVRWWFMILPCVAIAVGVLFVLGTMLQTRWLGLRAWKTDVLASIVYGFDDELREKLEREERSVGDMDFVGDDVRIRLVDSEKRRYLRAQD